MRTRNSSVHGRTRCPDSAGAISAAATIAQGGIYTNAGDGKVSQIDPRDIAASASVVLTQPGHAGATYSWTGPEAIGFGLTVSDLHATTGDPASVSLVGCRWDSNPKPWVRIPAGAGPSARPARAWAVGLHVPGQVRTRCRPGRRG